MILKQHFALVAGLVLALASASWSEEYVKLEPQELKSNPQAYWARGIVFSDVLESAPTAELVKLGDRKYHLIQTRVLGDCYIDSALKETVSALKLGEPYIFSGSVYQKKSGYVFSKVRFFVVIKSVTSTVKEASEQAEALRLALTGMATNNFYIQPLQILDKVLTVAQRDLQAYCASSNVDITAVFTPGSPHAGKAVQSVRQALYAEENESKVPTVEFTVSLLTSLLAAHNGGLKVEAPAVAAIPEAQPVAVPEVVPDPPANPESEVVMEEPAIEAPPAEVVVAEIPEPAPEPLPEPMIEEPAPVVVPEPEPQPEPVIEPIPEPIPEPMPEPAPAAEIAPEELPLIDAPAEVLEEPPVKTSLPGAKLKLALDPEPEPAEDLMPILEPEPEAKPEPKPQPKPEAKPKKKPTTPAPALDLNAPVPRN